MEIKIFLCYAREDVDWARQITQKLLKNGVLTWFPDELYPGDSAVEFLDKSIPILELIKREITARDYVLVLLSNSYINSNDFNEMLSTVFSDEWASRGITTLPVLLADCKPPAFLKPGQYFSIQTDSEKDIDDLVSKVKKTRYLDFSKLKEDAFSLLIKDLLVQQGFENIKLSHVQDAGTDIIAQYRHSDKQGEQATETWFVELKLYHSARASVETIYQFEHFLRTNTANGKGLLITNSQLTAAANQVLAENTIKGKSEIQVIEGAELKRLLLQHGDLIDKYFVKSIES